MEFTFWKELLDYGGMVVIAIGMFWWLIKVDIPKRERRHTEDRKAILLAFKEERTEMLAAFKEDRNEIIDNQNKIKSAISSGSRTCAVNRNLGMVQFLMEHDEMSFETASAKILEYWKQNGIVLEA